MRETYLDNSATTQPYPLVVEKVKDMMEHCWGNPSALHHHGFLAEKELTAAREAIAKTLRCDKSEITFTSGGTEADNMAVFGTVAALRRKGNHVVTTRLEHPAILRCFEQLEKEGFQVDYIPVDAEGNLDLEFAQKVIGKQTILVSVMLVNNELGTLFPVKEIRSIMDRAGCPGYLHTDCVQAYGKIPFTPKSLGADLLTISSHKIHGPKGAGALYIKKGVRILPTVYGGGQEKGLRSGTENTYALCGFGAAAAETFRLMPKESPRLQALRDETARRILEEVPDCVINTPKTSAPHILNISVLGLKSEVMLHFLESRGIYVSAGSACSAKSGKESHVLFSAGLSKERIDSALRISFGHFNTQEDCDALIEGLKLCREELKGKNTR